MTTTTIDLDITDARESITVSAGGAAGSQGLKIVIDNSKLTTQAAVAIALERARDKVIAGWPLAAS